MSPLTQCMNYRSHCDESQPKMHPNSSVLKLQEHRDVPLHQRYAFSPRSCWADNAYTLLLDDRGTFTQVAC